MPGLSASIPLLGVPDSVGGSPPPTVDADVTESLGVTYGLDVTRARPVTITDVIDIGEVVGSFYGMVVVERLRLALMQASATSYHLTLSDVMRLASRIYPAATAIITESIAVELVQQAQQAVAVIEQLGLTSVLAPAAIYQRSFTETIRIATSLGRFFGGDLVEGIGFAPTLGVQAAFHGLLSDTIGIAPSITPRFILTATAIDALVLDDVDALSMIYNGQLTDDIRFNAGYVSPDGQFTTWAINTRTGATTEYSNYAFNSFAKLGDTYIGASSSGLFTLLGDDDDGADIIASIKSGFAEWGGSKFTMFKAAYLGVRGGGDYVLKLTTGDDKTYVYSVSARDMRSTKINVGKGIRTRYFAFELINTGQDFDLDTIEFVPIVAARRV